MIFKTYLVFLFLISVSFSFGQQNRKPKGPRDYTDEYPETRRLPPTASIPIVDTLEIKNNNSSNNHTLKPRKFNASEHSGTSEYPECAKCSNNTRYLKHYYAKGCKPVEGEIRYCNKMCPKYFDCPKKEIKTPPTGCEYKGHVYKFNEKVPVDNPCKKGCFCERGPNPKITCADVECFGDFSLPAKNCYNVFELNECCSTSHKCPTDDELKNIETCSYRGKQYKLGERIYPEEDTCSECICDENWNQRRLQSNLNSTSCRKISCELELISNSRDGCIPIYTEKSCCPIEYHCPPPKEHHCFFDGQQYRIGEKLNIGDITTECICRIPPEFTCIKRSFIPYKPVSINSPETVRTSEKFAELEELVQTPPTFDKAPSREKIALEWITNRSEPIRPSELTRPTRPINNSDLLRPAKPINSSELVRPVQQTTAKPRTKPHKCPPFIEGGLSCAGFNCTTIFDSNGCQACSCEKPCPDLECNDPCYVFAVTPGECPRCKCP